MKLLYLNKTIFLFVLITNCSMIFGQKKSTLFFHVERYIINNNDTIKIQRCNSEDYDILEKIEKPSFALRNLIKNIEYYIEARKKGEIPDDSNEAELRFNLLIKIANSHNVNIYLENYKKELSFYRKEDNRLNNEKKEQLKKEEALKKKKFDSLIDSKVKDKEITDSIEFEKQKRIKEVIEKEKKNIEIKNLKTKTKLQIEIAKNNKIESQNKIRDRRSKIINIYGKENGEAILNHKVKIGWSKSMCFESWGKPQIINRTINAFGTIEQCVYSLKKYLYFENGILTTIQD